MKHLPYIFLFLIAVSSIASAGKELKEESTKHSFLRNGEEGFVLYVPAAEISCALRAGQLKKYIDREEYVERLLKTCDGLPLGKKEILFFVKDFNKEVLLSMQEAKIFFYDEYITHRNNPEEATNVVDEIFLNSQTEYGFLTYACEKFNKNFYFSRNYTICGILCVKGAKDELSQLMGGLTFKEEKEKN